MMMFTVSLHLSPCHKKEVGFAFDDVHRSVQSFCLGNNFAFAFWYLCMLKNESIYNIWMISKEEDGFNCKSKSLLSNYYLDKNINVVVTSIQCLRES